MGRPLLRHRHLFLDIFRERLFTAGLLFVGTWLTGGLAFWLIGRFYGVNDQLVLPDGSLDHANFGFLNCLYLAAMVVSTLGFADLGMLNRVPGEGRDLIYTVFMVYALSAYVVMVYATAQMVGYVVEGALTKYLEKRRMERDLSTIANHYVVCGLGGTGMHIVNELVKVEEEVVGVDLHREAVEEAKRRFPDGLFLVGDATADDALEHAGTARARGVFCAVGADNDNIIAVLGARHLNAKARIVGRARNLANLDKLKQVGADAVISPNHIGGLRMASEMLRPAAVTFMDTMMRAKDATMRFENVLVQDKGPAAGRLLGELQIPSQLGLVVVALVQHGGTIQYNPGPQARLDPGDGLVVIASPEQRRALERMVNGT